MIRGNSSHNSNMFTILIGYHIVSDALTAALFKVSVTVRYIFVYCRLKSLFAKKSIWLRYIKLHIDTFVMIIRTLSEERLSGDVNFNVIELIIIIVSLK